MCISIYLSLYIYIYIYIFRALSVEAGTVQRILAWPLAQGRHAQFEKCKYSCCNITTNRIRISNIVISSIMYICICIYIYIYTYIQVV